MPIDASGRLILSHERPPIMDELERRFGVSWNDAIVSWEGKIHAKSPIPPQKWIHEDAHIVRQGAVGNEAWWEAYLSDPSFRLEEEKIAHRAEADFIRRAVKDRNAVYHMVRAVASSLSDGMYGELISFDDALRFLMRK